MFKSYRQNIRIEDDVVRIEANLVDQNIERPFTNFDLAIFASGLADLVEGHHYNGSAVLLNRVGLFDEILFTLLQRDWVDDALSLTAFKPGLHHFEVRRVLRFLGSV